MTTTKMISINNLTEDKLAQTLMHKSAQAREEAILAQLNDLIQKGILVLKTNGSSFYRASDSNELIYKEQILVELKDREYIEKLEKENAEMRAYIDGIKNLLKHS